jgi:hypothetical protein
LVDVLVFLLLLLLLLLLLWRFGPFSGHDLPIAGVSTQLSFYEVRMTGSQLDQNSNHVCYQVHLEKQKGSRWWGWW